MHITGDIKKILNETGVSPNKVLGQNFLINTDIYEKIIDIVNPSSNTTIVEVGPGLGTLTKYIADYRAHVLAVEKDKTLIPYLEKLFANDNNVKIINSDILKWNPKDHGLDSIPFTVVGNIPYYLSSRLMRMIFESWPVPEHIVFMVQYEVAQKMTAKPPDMTLLGVATQYYSEAKLVAKISRGNFYPEPKVDSAIISMHPKKIKNNKKYNELFFKIVTAGFHQKRKKLINNLIHMPLFSREYIEKTLKLLNIDPGLRPEALTIETWEKLTTHIYYQQ